MAQLQAEVPAHGQGTTTAAALEALQSLLAIGPRFSEASETTQVHALALVSRILEAYDDVSEIALMTGAADVLVLFSQWMPAARQQVVCHVAMWLHHESADDMVPWTAALGNVALLNTAEVMAYVQQRDNGRQLNARVFLRLLQHFNER